MDKREIVSRIIAGDYVLPEIVITKTPDGILHLAPTGPEKPMWQHELYLKQADRILEALEITNA